MHRLIASTIRNDNCLIRYKFPWQINARCPIPLTGRRRRETDGGMAGGLIRRSARGTITVPLDTLNDSAHCLLKNMGLFTHLPDTLCGGEGVSSGNDNCWNGRQLGRYVTLEEAKASI